MYVDLRKTLEWVVDEHIERGGDSLELIDETRSSIIKSLSDRDKEIPDRIKKLDIYRGLIA